MVKFKVGDIVKPNDKTKGKYAITRKGNMLEGKITYIDEKNKTMSVLMKKMAKGFLPFEGLEFESLKMDCFDLVAPKRELHVTSDGTTTHAVLKEGGKIVKRAKAVCSPDDEYSFETGARLAIDRVFGKEEKSAEEKGAAREPKFKFEVGNMVKVVDSGKTYCLFDDIMQQYGADYLMRWAYGVPAPKDGQYEVVQRNKHPDLKIMLYVIERKDGYSHPLYIISEDGLTKAWQRRNNSKKKLTTLKNRLSG